MSTFTIATDAIDVSKVPYKTLSTEATIPAVGLGTFGSDAVDAETIAMCVREALALGYRHIDCASVYGNEKEIGKVFKEIFSSDVIARDEMWITSKVWNDMHKDVIKSCKQSLYDLDLEYLDLYLVHWPFPNFHPPGCDVTSRIPDAKPYIHEDFMNTWSQMEQLVKAGLVRHIGTSNTSIAKLQLMLRDAHIVPHCNEMELHPHFQQPKLFDYVVQNNIVPIGFSPIGSPARPKRDRTADDTVDVQDPILMHIADRHNIHPATACVKWAMQRGQVPIPFSTNRKNIKSNLECSTTAAFSDEEMKRLSNIDKNCRLIKGQVFLWKENQSWKDLWDEDGEIALYI